MHGPYEHMRPIESAPVDSVDRKRLGRIARAICGRTGLHCHYNCFDKSLFFHYTPEPDSGPLRLPVFNYDGSMRIWSDIEIENAVRYVQYGKMKRSMKDREADKHRKNQEYEHLIATEKHLDERRPGARDRMAFRQQTRNGLRKVISV